MPIMRNFTNYHSSISDEFKSYQDRIRNLIGESHWLTDGEHKEAVVRKIFKSHMPNHVSVGKGFACGNTGNTSQIDVLVVNPNSPFLYKDDDLFIVTTDAPSAIIEVKTDVDMAKFKAALRKVSDNISLIRKDNNIRCKAGIFIYEDCLHDPLSTLSALNEITEGDKSRVIDWISIGHNKFIHYWEKPKIQVNGLEDYNAWHIYNIDRLAPAYFLNNMIISTTIRKTNNNEYAWYPIEGGKEQHRIACIALNIGSHPKCF